MQSALRIVVASLILSCLAGVARSEKTFFSLKPIWSSKTKQSGGDGIARFIDFDKDGDLDFLTSAPNPRRWVIYRNDAGTIGKKPVWESNTTTDCDHVDVLDFNRDGWPDLAATHESHCTLYFNKRGKFNKKPDWETGIIANANQIDFGDFDNDGDLDMIMAAGKPINGVALFENKTGTPDKKPTRKIGHSEYCETAIFADFDGDKDLDIVACYPSGKVAVYRNTKDTFDNGGLLFEDKQSRWTQRVYLADLDRNGQAEIFCAKGPWGNRRGRSLQLVSQPLNSKMKIRWQSSPRSAFHGLAFHDVDKDGDVDLIAADYRAGGLILIYLNNGGKLSTKPAWSVKPGGPAHEIVLGDIDKDGDLDLAVGCRDQAHIYENLTITKAKATKPK